MLLDIYKETLFEGKRIQDKDENFVIYQIQKKFHKRYYKMQTQNVKQIFIIYKTYRIEFYKNQGTLLIVCKSLDHSTKGQGKYNDVTIRQLSNNLLENTDDFMEFIQLNKNQQQTILITEAGKLVVNFKYIMNKKEKVKKIQFALEYKQIDEITGLKMQNLELKQKVNKLENQMVYLKNQLGNQLKEKVNNLENQMAHLKNYLANQIQNLGTTITTLQNKKITTLDQLYVHGITFTNGWRIGYYDNNQYFGFRCGDQTKGHWLKKVDQQKIIKNQ